MNRKYKVKQGNNISMPLAKNLLKVLVLVFVFMLYSNVAYAAVSVETFTCNGQSGTVVVENSVTFSCQASIKNEDTQNSAAISSVSLLVSGNWAEQTSYTGTGFLTSIGAGASTTATFSGIKAVAPGPTNKFQSIQIDSSSDTFVTNTNVNVIAIKSLAITPSATSVAQNSEFDVEAKIIAGGDLSSVTMTWSGSGGCTLASGHTASKSAGSLSHNSEATRSWRVAQGSSSCVSTITASGTSSSVTTTKSGSTTVAVSGAGSSGSSGTSGGGGGGGGGAGAANVSNVTAAPVSQPTIIQQAVCGNNVREGSEECDGSDLVGQTCTTRGFAGGTLACSNCRFDTSRCVLAQPTTKPTQPPYGITIPIDTGSSIVYVILALVVVAVLGYWHYHHSPHKNKIVYRPKS